MSQYDPIRYQPIEAPFAGKKRADLVSTDWEHKSARVTLVGVLGLLVGTLSLFLADIKDGSLLLFLIIGLVVFLLAARFFKESVVLLLALAWVNIGSPAIMQSGSGSAQRLMISHMLTGLLLCIWAGRQIFQPKPLYKNPVVLPLIVYIGICIWSVINSFVFPNAAVEAGTAKQYFQVNVLEIMMRVLVLGAIVLVANSLEGRLLRVGMVVILLPGLLSALGLKHVIPTATEWSGFIEILTMSVLASFALHSETRLLWRILSGVLALMIFGVLFVLNAEWISGWFGASIALFVISLHANPRLLRFAAIAIALMVVLNFGYFYKKIYKDNFYGSGPTTDIYRVGQMGTFNSDRARMFVAALKYAQHFPLGIGLGNYRAYNLYFGQLHVWNTTNFSSAHGTFAQTLSETGWPGLAALLWLLIACGTMLKRFYKSAPAGPIRIYLLGAWGAVTGIFCASLNGDYLFPTYHNGGLGHFGICLYVWLLIGLSMAIAREHGLSWQKPDLVSATEVR